MISRRSPLRRGAPPKKRNAKRRTREWLRAYGSEARVEFVKSLPCVACGVVGYSENAHCPPVGKAGLGYKADAKWIAPLCGRHDHYTGAANGGDSVSCHAELHWVGLETFETTWDIDLEDAAIHTEQAWLAHVGEAP